MGSGEMEPVPRVSTNRTNFSKGEGSLHNINKGENTKTGMKSATNLANGGAGGSNANLGTFSIRDVQHQSQVESAYFQKQDLITGPQSQDGNSGQ